MCSSLDWLDPSSVVVKAIKGGLFFCFFSYANYFPLSVSKNSTMSLCKYYTINMGNFWRRNHLDWSIRFIRLMSDKGFFPKSTIKEIGKKWPATPFTWLATHWITICVPAKAKWIIVCDAYFLKWPMWLVWGPAGVMYTLPYASTG